MRKFVFALMLFITPTLAQDQPPVLGGQATEQLQQLSQTISDAKRILIIGDQMAGGMGAGFTRMGENDPNIQVSNRFNESSGLVRPEIYDWAQAIPNIIEGKDFTAAFILIGLNDRRDMRNGDQLVKFNSPEWVALYKLRVDAVIDALSTQHIQVFWMGEPPMGDAALDVDMQTLTSYQKERAAAKGATFIDLRTPLLGADGKYTDRGQDETGADRRLRQSDGVTFFKQGNNRLGLIALAALNSGSTAPQVPALADPAATAVAPVEIGPSPIFGQQDANGGVVAKSSSEIVAVAAAKQADQSSSIGIGAAHGSNADKLFTTGLSDPAPAGRFDDFSEVAN